MPEEAVWDLELDRQSAVPLYRQIYDRVKLNIVSGQILPKQHLPGQADLCETLSVNLVTIRKAMSLLEQDGLIERKRRAGSFVLEKEHWRTRHRLPRVAIVQMLRPWTRDLLKPFKAELFKAMADLSIESHMIMEEDAKSMKERFQGIEIDAVICMTISPEVEGEFIRSLSLPCVSIEGTVREPHVDSIINDSVGGTQRATQALIDLGHTDIAFVGGLLLRGGHWKTGDEYWVPNQDYYRRVAGYRQAIHNARLPYDGNRVYEIPFDPEPAKRLVSQWILERKLPTAVVAFDDTMAGHLYEALQDEKIDVPGDISLVGFGDFVSDAIPCGLATVEVDWKEMARCAAMRISDRIANGGVAGMIYEVETHYKPGGSVAAPRVHQKK